MNNSSISTITDLNSPAHSFYITSNDVVSAVPHLHQPSKLLRYSKPPPASQKNHQHRQHPSSDWIRTSDDPRHLSLTSLTINEPRCYILKPSANSSCIPIKLPSQNLHATCTSLYNLLPPTVLPLNHLCSLSPPCLRLFRPPNA